MNNQADIKRRLASVKQTRQITGAMEMISVSKMRKSLERFDENRVYFDTLESVVAEIFGRNDPEILQFTKSNGSGKKVVIVAASDKGLCGGFNHDVLKLADGIVEEDTIVMPIGHIALEHFATRKRRGENFVLDDRFVSFSAPDYKNSKRIADDILSNYGKAYGEILLVYTRLKSHSVWDPEVIKLLPMEEIADVRGRSDVYEKSAAACTEFEPSAAEVFVKLMPLYLGGVIYGAFVHSTAAEHSARRAAMSASAKNADEISETLSLEYNRARQSAVTEQITEIIGSRTQDG